VGVFSSKIDVSSRLAPSLAEQADLERHFNDQHATTHGDLASVQHLQAQSNGEEDSTLSPRSGSESSSGGQTA